MDSSYFIPAVLISCTSACTNFNILFCSNRAEEMNNSQLTELEEDIQRQLAATEERVREEVSVIHKWTISPVIYFNIYRRM